MEIQSVAKYSITERLFSWLIVCGDMCSMAALFFVVVVISLVTWIWPDAAH